MDTVQLADSEGEGEPEKLPEPEALPEPEGDSESPAPCKRRLAESELVRARVSRRRRISIAGS